MQSVHEKRIAVEKLIVAALDMILEARGFDGEMLLVPEADLRARYLLRDGRVPDAVLDNLIAIAENTLLTAAVVAAHDVSKAAA